MNFTEKLTTIFPEEAKGFKQARAFKVQPETSRPQELPFPVATKEMFLAQFDKLSEKMKTETLSLQDGYQLLLEGKMPWRLSPESRIAHLYAEQSQIGKFTEAQNQNHPDAWRQLTPLHHEESYVRANEIWKSYRSQLLTNNTDHPFLSRLLKKESAGIDALAAKILTDKPNLTPELARTQAIDTLIGQPFIEKTSKNIRATKAYFHGKRLSNRAGLATELINIHQSIATELPKSSFKIGAQDKSGQPIFFEMAMIKNITIDPQTGKEKWFPQGLLIQEPGWTDEMRKNRSVGLAILPWYEAYYQAPSQDIYVNIGLRNEPGADNYSTAVTGEQVSATKMVKGDFLKQPGGNVIAVCVGEKLAFHCEQVPELVEEVPEMDVALANRDGNRMGGGHNAYAVIKVEAGSPLFPQYAKNLWIKLTDLEELIDESNKDRPLVNDLLLAAKDQLNRRLRQQAEERDQAKSAILHEIANNPKSELGWILGATVNWIESLIKH